MEPLAIIFIFFSWYFLSRRRLVTSAIFLGYAITTKQYLILMVPAITRLLWRWSTKKFVIYFVSTTLIIVLICAPFVIWDQDGFIRNVISLQINYPPRYEGLTLFSFLHMFGINYNGTSSNLLILCGLLIIFFQKKIDLQKYFYLTTFLLFTFFIFNKWAFINYYYLIIQLLVIQIAHSKKISN